MQSNRPQFWSQVKPTLISEIVINNDVYDDSS